MIKAIIFDCFGVLTTDTWKVFVEGLPKNTDRARLRELNRTYDSARMPLSEFLDKVKEITGKEPPLVEELLDNEITKDTRLLNYIADLKSQGYKIGLLSNIGSDWITDSFLTPEEQKLFDDMVFSFQVGMAKPDPKIFQLSCERLGVIPGEALLIDDVDRYCEAAQKEGMSVILYKNISQFKIDLNKILTDTNY